MYYVHGIGSKDTVLCKGLVIFTLESINVMRSCFHSSVEVSLYPKVVQVQPHKLSCADAELLDCGDHVDSLV